MIYLATASGPRVIERITAGDLGQMVQPNVGNRVVEGAQWAADNGCFSDRWDIDVWAAWLGSLDRIVPRWQECLFAVVPDVVADAAATAQRWGLYADVVHDARLPAAWVAQDGAGPGDIPDDATAVFIGGSTHWKLGPEARVIAAEAKRTGRWLHMGRVNSWERTFYAYKLGCDSVDGTFLAYGPNIRLPELLGWLRRLGEPTLFQGVA